MHPLKRFEEEVNFYSMSGINVGEPIRTPLPLVRGLINFNTAHFKDGNEPIPGFVSCTVFLSNSDVAKISVIKFGDWFTTQLYGPETIFEVTEIDLLGRLPGGYPNRLAGERR